MSSASNSGGDSGYGIGGRPVGRGASSRPGGAGRKEGGKRYFFRRRKVCKFCADKIDYIDYKDVKL
ncbi:MAG TPA: 30S ribosomal protein S18, partial [Vicinamibacteria bacterium]|nr:30S ribosomal protein S18 [Vicinamibacteria bacterium]